VKYNADNQKTKTRADTEYPAGHTVDPAAKSGVNKFVGYCHKLILPKAAEDVGRFKIGRHSGLLQNN
jgi:hypothetical protein